MARNDNNEAHTIDYYEQYENTISNGEARIPICIVVDTSTSMQCLINDDSELIRDDNFRHMEDGSYTVYVKPRYPWVHLTHRIEELNKVLFKMISKMRNNEIIKKAAVICIVTFDQFANCLCGFKDIGKISTESLCEIKIGKNKTNTARGLQMALDRLDDQMNLNRNAGNDSYRPVLIFMSDGLPTDREEAETVRQQVRARSDKSLLNVIPIGIGLKSETNDCAKWLSSLSTTNHVYSMNVEKDFEMVYDMITSRIHNTTLKIAVDDNVSNVTEIEEINEAGIASTGYGIPTEDDDLNDFLSI